MALKSAQPAKAENPEELLEIAEQSCDRLRVMYEQYFLGMQKQAPGVLHSEVERRLRDLQQANLRNTALRYRFATLQQKFASYNAYWRRTLRQIENGTYARNLHKIGRAAVRSGADVPEEILAAMPKRMREQVQRDRAMAVAQAERRNLGKSGAGAMAGSEDELLDLADAFGHEEAPMELPPEELADVVAMINEPSELRRTIRAQRQPHKILEDDGELDIDSFFAAVEAEGPAAAQPSRRPGDSGVNFRAVTRSTAPPVAPPAPAVPPQRQTQPLPAQVYPPAPPAQRPSPQMPAQPPPLGAQTSPQHRPSQTLAAQTSPQHRPSQQMPAQPPAPPPPPVVPPQPRVAAQMPPLVRPATMTPAAAQPVIPPPARKVPTIPPAIPRPAPSQATRPNPIAPGSAATARLPVPMPTQPLPRPPAAVSPVTPPAQAGAPPPRPAPAPRQPPPRPLRAQTEPDPPRAAPPPPARPPPGMTDADVNALYAKYVKAKEMVGEAAGPGAYGKLLKTINSQAPKIMEQYNAKGVDFQVVVKDNQVIIRAKPKP